ncbi:MAG: hypothetical protein ACRDRJ_45850, partial [Streptosporangiaceae bacterium]
MYSIITALSADRIKEWHEQAATERLVLQARRTRRAAAAEARARRRSGSTRWARRSTAGVPAQRVPA